MDVQIGSEVKSEKTIETTGFVGSCERCHLPRGPIAIVAKKFGTMLNYLSQLEVTEYSGKKDNLSFQNSSHG